MGLPLPARKYTPRRLIPEGAPACAAAFRAPNGNSGASLVSPARPSAAWRRRSPQLFPAATVIRQSLATAVSHRVSALEALAARAGVVKAPASAMVALPAICRSCASGGCRPESAAGGRRTRLSVIAASGWQVRVRSAGGPATAGRDQRGDKWLETDVGSTPALVPSEGES
jgi:hypothetical protein